MVVLENTLDPRGVLKELGNEVSDDVEVRVWDSTAELRYLVLPERPAGKNWSAARTNGTLQRAQHRTAKLSSWAGDVD
jgi:Nitrile hydratase, alpha chain